MNKQKMPIVPFPGMTEGSMLMSPLKIQYPVNSSSRQQKLAIRRLHGWTYTELGTKVPDDIIKSMIVHFSTQISEMYLKRYRTFFTGDDSFDYVKLSNLSRENMSREIIRFGRRLCRKSKNDIIICKLISIKHTFLLRMEFIRDENLIRFMSFNFNATNTVCKCCVDSKLLIDEAHSIVRLGGTPYYIGKKDREIDAFIKSEGNVSCLDDTTLRLIYISLRTFLDEYDEKPPIDPDDIPHNSCEMYVLKRILKQIGMGIGWPVDVRNWRGKTYKSNPCTEMFDKVTPVFIVTAMNKNHSTYPLIDISEKEMTFVEKYVNNNHMFTNNSDADTDRFNLRKYIENTPYGDTWRYPIEYDDGSVENVITSFIFNDDLDALRIFIIKEVSPGIIAFCSVDYVNISDFHAVESITAVNASALFTDLDKMVESTDELCSLITSDMLDLDDILDTIEGILSIHIVIHDRPTRTRMVNCTRRVTEEERKRNRNSKDEREFVVTRILKTASEAKEYAARMSSEYPEREYTLESWNRRGFYRKTKGGGVVWVAPTTCHRHLELTSKEIHLKL